MPTNNLGKQPVALKVYMLFKFTMDEKNHTHAIMDGQIQLFSAIKKLK